MVGISTIGVGLVSYMGNRIVTNQDEVGKSILRLEIRAVGTSNVVDSIKQEMVVRRQTQEARDDEVRQTLTDHETRLRVIERHRTN